MGEAVLETKELGPIGEIGWDIISVHLSAVYV